MGEPRRPDRVAEAIREEVATFLSEGAKDPRIRGFVTVTAVDMTRDLRQATVFVSISHLSLPPTTSVDPPRIMTTSGGLLFVDKPAGLTSHDVVARVRRAARTKRVGHAGTLDPFATGLLVLAIGTATRLMQFIDGDWYGARDRIDFISRIL